MKSFFVLAVLTPAIALSLALAHTNNNQPVSAGQSLNGPFRDGVYLGALAASRGEAPHISSGRWAAAADRQSFAKGYTQGYEQARAVMRKDETTAPRIGAA